MRTICTALLIGALTAAIIAISYLINVGIATLSQWAINFTFQTSFDYNVWGIGLILTIIELIFRGRGGKA
ncbi:MAG: hypothetical protein WA087_00660 [Candidatus Saccharimonadales bacterium]